MSKKKLTTLIGIFLLCLTMGFAEGSQKDEWIKNANGSNYKYEQSDFTTFEYNPATSSAIILKGYTLNPGSAPDGYSYVKEKTVASGGGLNVSYDNKQDDQDDANNKFRQLKLAGTATATLYVRTDGAPTAFNIMMSGELTKSGNGGGKVTWNASVGTQFYWVETPQEKILTIPVGTNASATAKHSSDSSYEKSTWKISGSGSTASINTAKSNIILNTIYSYKPMFVNSTFQGIPAGKHTVEGTSAKDTSKKDTATWEVVQGDFYNNSTLAFDDYTGFSDQTKYYPVADRYSKGRAAQVYTVIKSGTSGKVKLNLQPTPITKDVSVVFGSSNLTTKQSKIYALTGSDTMTAKLDSATLCSATIYSYNTSTKYIKIVRVNGDTRSGPNSGINTAYNAICINWLLYTQIDSINYTPTGSNSTWTSADLNGLRNLAAYSTPASNTCILFLLPGNSSTSPNTKGETFGSTRHAYIYACTTASQHTTIIAHEMGHCLGLADEYNTQTGAAGPDILNIMNNTYNNSIFRKGQWTTISR